MADPKEISPEFPFTSNYIEVHGSNIHYVDEGSGDPIVFLHGNPESSYIWRNIIPYLSPLGRCIAPDLIGMGKSDKPDIEYRFFDHVKYVEGFIRRMALENITFVIHDWGSALGFYYAMRHESNVKGIAFMEAFLMPIPSWDKFGPKGIQDLFKSFRTPEVGWDMIVNQNMFIEGMQMAVVRELTEKEMDHYREPFCEPETRKPVWRWPNEIPIEGSPPDMAAVFEDYSKKLRKSDLAKLLFYADQGILISPSVVAWCRKNLRNLTVVNIGPGIHYVQEDNPHIIGSKLSHWYQDL